MLERLDRLSAERWARLRDGVRRARLRRGAWYPVLSEGPGEVVVVVRHESVVLPPSYLDIVTTRPSKWSLLTEERYAVCPNCAQRVALGTPPERMRCGRCHEVFEFEEQHEHSVL